MIYQRIYRTHFIHILSFLSQVLDQYFLQPNEPHQALQIYRPLLPTISWTELSTELFWFDQIIILVPWYLIFQLWFCYLYSQHFWMASRHHGVILYSLLMNHLNASQSSCLNSFHHSLPCTWRSYSKYDSRKLFLYRCPLFWLHSRHSIRFSVHYLPTMLPVWFIHLREPLLLQSMLTYRRKSL